MHRYTKSMVLAIIALLIGGLVAGLEPEGAVAGGGCRGTISTEASGDTVRMEGTCFMPTVLHTKVGSQVSWTNTSDLPHSVAGATVEWGNYNELTSGASVTYAFDKPGTYPYYCFVHNGMIGAIVVDDAQGRPEANPNEVAQAARRLPSNREPNVTGPTQSASSTESLPDGNRAWFAGLGAAMGAATVAAGFGIRKLRRS